MILHHVTHKHGEVSCAHKKSALERKEMIYENTIRLSTVYLICVKFKWVCSSMIGCYTKQILLLTSSGDTVASQTLFDNITCTIMVKHLPNLAVYKNISRFHMVVVPETGAASGATAAVASAFAQPSAVKSVNGSANKI